MTLTLSRIIKLLFVSLFVIVPLYFNSDNSETFEIPKMYYIYAVSLAIIFLHLLNYLRGKISLYQQNQLNIFFLIFFLSQTIATLTSIDQHVSFFGFYSRLNGGLLSTATFTALYFILPNYLDEKLTRQIINFSLFSGLIIAIYGILQHLGIDKHSWKQDVQARVFSTLGQPNWLAAYICILLPFSLDHFQKSKGLILKTLYSILNISFFLCLLFTKSKSGIIAAFISLSIYGFLNLIKNKTKTSLYFGIWILVFGILSCTVSNPIKDFFFPQKMSNGSTINDKSLVITPSEDIRKIVWQGAIDLWKRYPIFGTGPETFAYSYYWTRPASHNLTSEWQFLYNKAHNEYLNYLATSGLIGFISYLFFVFSILYTIRNTIYLIPFLSILITNITGFSVATTSLFFYLLPALSHLDSLPKNHLSKTSTSNSSATVYQFILTVVCIFLGSKLIIFYLADQAYSKSVYFDNHNLFEKSYQFANVALKLRPQEPTYLIQRSTLSAKVAIVNKNPTLTKQTLDDLNLAVSISPYDTNLQKQRAQVYYYLSTFDKNYYINTLNTLIHLTEIAPTDPTNFYLLGKFLQNINETDKAIEYYQKSIKLKPNYDHATFALGELFFQQKKYIEAKPLLEQTVTVAPTNLQAKDYLARIATSSSSR